MIPTLILVGLLVGILPRPWHLVGLLVTAVAWPSLIVVLEPAYAGNPGWLFRSLALSTASVAIGLIFMKRLAIPSAVLFQSLASLLREHAKNRQP